jgi:hypothetical protein
MAALEELKNQFIVDEQSIKSNLESLVGELLKYCVVDTSGRIHLKSQHLRAKEKVKLALAARLVASQLDNRIPADVSTSELVEATGLPQNQVRARATEVINERFAQSNGRGIFRANPHRLQQFISGISGEK